MNNIQTENKGIITLGSKVMVSDPCYGLGTWCQGVLKNVLPGQYACKVEYSDEGDWGIRVSAIEVTHVDYKGKFLALNLEDFEVGVDSGQAGIFDYEYYAKYHMDATERPHVNDVWYDRCGDLTHVRVENPNYERFDWEKHKNDSDIYDQLEEYEASDKSVRYFTKCDGNVIDGLGIVSSSGYGDGGYDCWTCRNEDGKIISIRVEFIGEDEDEEDE